MKFNTTYALYANLISKKLLEIFLNGKSGKILIH